MKHIEDNNYENMFWGYAENEKDFTDFLLSLWNKKDYDRYRGAVISSNNVFQNEESIFFDIIRAKFPDDCEEYPSPTETYKYTIGKKPKESEYPVVLLYDATSSIDSVFTWVSLNKFKGENND